MAKNFGNCMTDYCQYAMEEKKKKLFQIVNNLAYAVIYPTNSPLLLPTMETKKKSKKQGGNS